MIGLISLIGVALINHEVVPSWLIALAPIAPIPFIAFGALIANVARIRGHLIDRYESEIRALTGASDGGKTLIPYGHTQLARVVWDAPFGRVVMGVSFVSLLTGYVAVIVACFHYAKVEHFALALGALIFVSITTSALIGLFVIALDPERAIGRGLKSIMATQFPRR